jgi:hypothetical protein
MTRAIAQKNQHLWHVYILVQLAVATPTMTPALILNLCARCVAILHMLELRKPGTYKPRQLRTIASFVDDPEFDTKDNFRFDAPDLFRLRNVLDLPRFKLQNGAVYVGEEVMLIVLIMHHEKH